MIKQLSSFRTSRRHFLKSTGAITTGLIVPGLTLSRGTALGARSPNNQIIIGCIGNGGMGSGDAMAARRNGRIVAFCDVDRQHAEALKAKLGATQATIDEDYRSVLDRKEIDAVTISTPDHWHTKIAVEAMQAGKDVYCQKPLTLTIDEGKILCRVTRQTKRVLQVGSQQRSEYRNRFLTAVAMVQGGRIGKVQRVTCILGTAPAGGPFAATVPPNQLDWDFWLGQAPLVPYIPQRCHGTFRWWYEYSGGKMTDWGAHHVDIAQWAIGMQASGPKSVEPLVGKLPVPYLDGYPTVSNKYNTATDFRLRYLFGNDLEMIVCNRDPNLPLDNGIFFQGTNGSFAVSRGDLAGPPVEQLRQDPIPEATLVQLRHGKAPSGHMANFFECIRDRGLPASDVYSHHRTLTSCHLGNIALRLSRKLQWNPDTEEIIGDPIANAFLTRKQRPGFEITG